MRKIILVVLAISIFSCKNASEKTENIVAEVIEEDITAETVVEQEIVLEEISEEIIKEKLTIDASLLFPFDMDLATFKKEPLKRGVNEGDCSKSFQKYSKNEIEISVDTFDCDVWGFNTYSFLLNNGKIVRANHKSAENISNKDTDFAARILTEKVFDFSVTPIMQYVRTDTITDFETKLMQSGFIKSEIKDSNTVYEQLMSQYSGNQEIILQHDGPFVLSEENLGSLPLKNGMNLNVYELREVFEGFEVSKKVGQQDGPDYFYYEIGQDISISTENTENETLFRVLIPETSKVKDSYGIGIGASINDLREKRAELKISTEHYHVFLFEEGSHIAYEMSLGDYNGPDKDAYTFDEIKNAKVISIIWE